MEKNKLTFEQALGRLQEITEQLENGNLPLEESMKLFEEGTKLAQLCGRQLDDAKQQITRLCDLPQEDA